MSIVWLQSSTDRSLPIPVDTMPLPDTVVVVTGYMLYGLAILIGIPSNIFVLTRMFRLARECSDVYSNGVGVCLFVMAITDIVSLLAITVHVALSMQTPTTLDLIGETTLNYVCKTVIFSMHVSTALSIWSWLLMSSLRFLSVYHPLLYIRMWHLPAKGLVVAFVIGSTVNAWLLVSVVNTPNGSGCTQMPLFNSELFNRVFLVFDSFWSFVIPCSIILFVDLCVFSSSVRYRGSKERKGVRRNRHSSLLPRWLLIAFVDIGLNAPENIIRLLTIIGVVEPDEHSRAYLLARQLAQVLYYSQFGFNSVYLALFIFDKSTRPSRRGLLSTELGEATPLRTDHVGAATSSPRLSLQCRSPRASICGGVEIEQKTKRVLTI